MELGGGWWCRCPRVVNLSSSLFASTRATNRLSSAQPPAAPSDLHVIDNDILAICREQGRQRLTVTPAAHQGVVLEGQPGQGTPFGCEGFLGLVIAFSSSSSSLRRTSHAASSRAIACGGSTRESGMEASASPLLESKAVELSVMTHERIQGGSPEMCTAALSAVVFSVVGSRCTLHNAKPWRAPPGFRSSPVWS